MPTPHDMAAAIITGMDSETLRGMAQSSGLHGGMALHRHPLTLERVRPFISGLVVAALFYVAVAPILRYLLPHWPLDAVNGLAALAGCFWVPISKWVLEVVKNRILALKTPEGGHSDPTQRP